MSIHMLYTFFHAFITFHIIPFMFPHFHYLITKFLNLFRNVLGFLIQLCHGFAMFRMFCLWLITGRTSMPMTSMKLIHRFRCFMVSINIVFTSYLILTFITGMSNMNSLRFRKIFQPFDTAFTECLPIFFHHSNL